MSEKEDRFRLRGPSWARWTRTEGDPALIEKSWTEAVAMVTAMDPKQVAGYRIEVNCKRERKRGQPMSNSRGGGK